MAIETAGEQRYYFFLEKRMKKHRLMDISSVSLICVAAIAFTSKEELGIFVGLVLSILGIVIAVLSYSSKKSLNKKLDIVGDKKKFFAQLVEKDTVEFKDLNLLITNDYLLKYSDDLYIYKFADMKNVELKNDRLYLVDKNRKRYEIAINQKGNENSFDTACQLLAILI